MVETLQRCLENPPKVAKGSPICKLLITAIPVIGEKLTWIFGNGKRINLWEDRILGRDCLSSRMDPGPLQDWMDEQGIITLFDISSWNAESDLWTNWKCLSPPTPLLPLFQSLIISLHGCTPWHRNCVDS